MIRETSTAILLYLLLVPPFLPAESAGVLSGRVVDDESALPVAHAMIHIRGTAIGTMCDSSGAFTLRLAEGTVLVECRALGYHTQTVLIKSAAGDTINRRIHLAPAPPDMVPAVLVHGKREEGSDRPPGWVKDTDAALESIPGISLIRRGGFGREPAIRGQSAGRIGITIDGMHVHGACVDRMDPVNAYVAVENLEQVEVHHSAADVSRGGTVAGTINLVTGKAGYATPFAAEVETGYQTSAALRRIRGRVDYSHNALALRGTFSVQEADNYHAGGGNEIRNSGFRKHNFKVDISRMFGPAHRLDLSAIGDNACDMGYPGLIMDATKALSRLYSISHEWSGTGATLQSLQSRLYYNRINHWMDDYGRDVSTREVMRNMYMPMYGETETAGIISEGEFVFNSHTLKTLAESYRLRAFADMDMISILPDVSPSYLVNVGDVRLWRAALGLSHLWRISGSTFLKNTLRLEYDQRDVHDQTGRRTLAANWPGTPLATDYRGISAAATVTHHFSATTRSAVSLARTTRLPTHLETYAYFVYDPVDGYFYYGNPGIRPEITRQIELTFSFQKHPGDIRISAFYNDIRDYIAGVLQDEEFKTYSNLERVYLAGGEISGGYSPRVFLGIDAAISYTYAQNQTFGEPLPYIPPLGMRISATFRKPQWEVRAGAAYNARQNRIAFRTTREDETPQHVTLDAAGRVRIHEVLSLKAGIENILDNTYHRHESVNNLPAPGRNFLVTLNFRLDPVDADQGN